MPTVGNFQKQYKGFRNFNVYSIHEVIFSNEANYAKFVDLFWKHATYNEIARELFTNYLRGSTPDGVNYTLTSIRLAVQHHVREARKIANPSRNLARFTRSRDRVRFEAEQARPC